MTIRSWHGGDMVDGAPGAPATWLEAQGREQLGAATAVTFVAEHYGDVVGAGCAYPSRWHPYRLWCYVEVAAPHRRSGHATALLQALRDSGTDRPLRGKVTAASPGAAFAEARSFRSIQRCRTVALHGPPRTTPGSVDDDPPRSDVAEAFRAFYAATHRWDPLGDIGADEFLGSHIDDAVARLLVRDRAGRAVAVGCLYDEGAALLLSGGPTSHDDDATGAMVASAVRYAAQAGRPLTAEVDDANASLVRALRSYAPVQIDETHVVADG